MAGSAPRLAGLLLAAGASRRLGRPKQLLVHGGRTLVERAADAALAVCDAGVVAVLGANRTEIEAALAGRALAIAANPRWEEGIGSSIAAGVARLPSGCDGVLVVLGDQAHVDEASLQKLVQRWRAERDRVVAAAYGGDAGAPAILPRRCFAALAALAGDVGARALIEREGAAALRVAMPEAGFDVDDEAAAAALEP
jgi:CTP:molybdopterin cytidylyltransferase MocA